MTRAPARARGAGIWSRQLAFWCLCHAIGVLLTPALVDAQSRGPRTFSSPVSDAIGSLPSPMLDDRSGVATARLSDGRVLVTGGRNMRGESVRDAELYDPASDSWLPVAPMLFKRWNHSATELSDGRVLIVGGGTGSSANPEIYDPASDFWTMAGSMASPPPSTDTLGHVTFRGTLTALDDGRILAVGTNGNGAQIYDPVRDQWEWAYPSEPDYTSNR